jgi:hypothetical protein
MTHEPGPRSPAAARFVAGPLGLAAFAVLMAANTMAVPSNQDEQQYVTGAYFARELSLYADFLHLQGPNYPLVLSAVYGLLGSDQFFYLTARVVNFAFAFGAAALVYIIALREARSVTLALSALLLFAGSQITVDTSK